MESNEMIKNNNDDDDDDSPKENVGTTVTPIILPIIDPEQYKLSESYMNDRNEFQQFIENNQNSEMAIVEYLEKYSQTNLNQFFHSLLYIIEWACTNHKHWLELYLANINDIIMNRLKLPSHLSDDKQKDDDEKIFTLTYREHFIQLHYEFFDLYFRFHRCITSFTYLTSLFPTLKWLMMNRSKQIGHYLCVLMARTPQPDTIEHIYDMIFELDICDDKSIYYDAMIIVFIKVSYFFALIVNFLTRVVFFHIV